MIHQVPSDDDLLQGRLDGALTPEESARLDARLEASPALRARASELASLAAALALVKATDPAPALAQRVMAHIQPGIESVIGRRASIAARQEAGMSQAGHAKKVMWGLAAAAVIVLAVWFVKGTPDVGGPAAGTVGVAKRYAAPQIADEDVKLEASAQTIQAFLDSEAFAQVMADPEAVALLGDPKVRSAIGARAANRDATPSPVANASIAAVIDDPSFVVLVTNPAFETSWHDAARQAADINGALEKARVGGNNATGLGSGLEGRAAGLGTGATGVNSGLKAQATGLGTGATGVNSGLTAQATGLGTGATGVNSGLKAQATGLGTGATGVNSGLKAQATGLNSGLGQNAALKGGLGQNATGLNSQLDAASEQADNAAAGPAEDALQSQLQNGLNGGLNSGLKTGLGQKSSQ